ncbi:hypothetical protein HDV00_008989 [Rhizophlyctis rosea]|nr:hypothetical protein HDV00_008989 [Rhizophlyctis rosea]
MQANSTKWNMSELRSRSSSVTPSTPKEDVVDNPSKLIKSRTDGALRRHSLVDHRSYFVRILLAVSIICLFWMRSTIVRWLGGVRLLPRAYQVVGVLFISLTAFYVAPVLGKHGKAYVIFAWNCFVKPFLKRKAPLGVDADQHQQRLEKFYEGQAEVYDVTRRRLLRGRGTMLKLCAAQLCQYYECNRNTATSQTAKPNTEKDERRCAWIDIGGGTGENVEKMNKYMPISNFFRIYVVDITPSLCRVAEERFKRLGWDNVRVLCMDAAKFQIPEEDGPETLEIALITMSYSLSMMESVYPLIDRLAQIISPTGIFGVADFYVSPKRSDDPSRQLSWLSRWFWAIWFDLDNVFLNPMRREYLEYKFKTIKSINLKNHFVQPVVDIPYYVWLGAKGDGYALSLESMAMEEFAGESDVGEEGSVREGMVEGVEGQREGGHVSSSHVHGQGLRWRQPFEAHLTSRFATYIYAFTWEDPQVDLKFMDLKPDDRMLCITSGGCNVLEYVAAVGPQRIYAVDLNPCQNNLLELKLAGIASLDYDSFYKLFGEGYLPTFSSLLDTHLSPHLSPYAYHFWKENADFTTLFKTGCSGLAIRVVQFVIKLRGLKGAVERMCNADTLEEQRGIWRQEIRPHFLSAWLIRILNNERFLWGALGIPPAQMQMVLKEGPAYDYIVRSLDPVLETTHLKSSNYFWYLPLMLRYDPSTTPAYLSPSGFTTLKSNPDRLDSIRIYTDVVMNVLNHHIADGELTKVVLMDHLDWFSEGDVDKEVEAVGRKLCKGGRAFWRSASRGPWYNRLFEGRGFRVWCLQVRGGDGEGGGERLLDRVNMYASFWCGEKL